MPADIIDIKVTPVLSTSPAYSSGDVLFDTTFVQNGIKQGYIRGYTILDKDAQSETGTIVFLKNLVVLGTINATPSISDTNAEEIIGHATVPTSINYTGSRANYAPVEIPFNITSGSTGLYVAMITGATGTHTASGIVVTIYIERLAV